MASFEGPLKKIGIYTSGGDAPGMNAAIRSAVRVAIYHGLEVVGIKQGYVGMLNGEFENLNLRSVSNIIQRGGTILKTGRSMEFHKADYRAKAAAFIKEQKIDGLICIGGDGSFEGARLLWMEHKIPVIGVPGTIDNDIFGTDYTIGFDTAVNTAVEACDRIRDTAASHDRIFIIEVMGRNSGFLALDVGMASGAEEVFVPDYNITVDQAIENIKEGAQKGKGSCILIAAEGEKPGRAYDLAEAIRKKSGFESKVCILGHIQRGGVPSARDRILASRLAAHAVESLIERRCDVMTGLQGEHIVFVPLENAIKTEKYTSKDLIQLARILSK